MVSVTRLLGVTPSKFPICLEIISAPKDETTVTVSSLRNTLVILLSLIQENRMHKAINAKEANADGG